MPLAAGVRLGPSEIVSAIGMGEVFRARARRICVASCSGILPKAINFAVFEPREFVAQGG